MDCLSKSDSWALNKNSAPSATCRMTPEKVPNHFEPHFSHFTTVTRFLWGTNVLNNMGGNVSAESKVKGFTK